MTKGVSTIHSLTKRRGIKKNQISKQYLPSGRARAICGYSLKIVISRDTSVRSILKGDYYKCLVLISKSLLWTGQLIDQFEGIDHCQRRKDPERELRT